MARKRLQIAISETPTTKAGGCRLPPAAVLMRYLPIVNAVTRAMQTDPTATAALTVDGNSQLIEYLAQQTKQAAAGSAIAGALSVTVEDVE